MRRHKKWKWLWLEEVLVLTGFYLDRQSQWIPSRVYETMFFICVYWCTLAVKKWRGVTVVDTISIQEIKAVVQQFYIICLHKINK